MVFRDTKISNKIPALSLPSSALEEVICIWVFISSSIKWGQYPVYQSQRVYKRLNDTCKWWHISAIKIVNGKGFMVSLLCMLTQNFNTTLTHGALCILSVRNYIETQLYCVDMFYSKNLSTRTGDGSIKVLLDRNWILLCLSFSFK